MDADARELGWRARELVADLPANLTIADRLALRNVVTATLARTAHALGLSQRSDIATAFLEWAAADVTSEDWLDSVNTLVECCAIAFETFGHRPSAAPYDIRVGRIIRVIATRYRDSGLTLSGAAAEVGLSRWHAVAR